MGKGSKRRPMVVSQREFEERWQKTFSSAQSQQTKPIVTIGGTKKDAATVGQLNDVLKSYYSDALNGRDKHADTR